MHANIFIALFVASSANFLGHLHVQMALIKQTAPLFSISSASSKTSILIFRVLRLRLLIISEGESAKTHNTQGVYTTPYRFISYQRLFQESLTLYAVRSPTCEYPLRRLCRQCRHGTAHSCSHPEQVSPKERRGGKGGGRERREGGRERKSAKTHNSKDGGGRKRREGREERREGEGRGMRPKRGGRRERKGGGKKGRGRGREEEEREVKNGATTLTLYLLDLGCQFSGWG